MKHLFCLTLTIIVVVSCVACGSQRMSGISDHAYEYGLAALETADEYIAGGIDADSAIEKLDHAGALVENCNGENDFYVSAGIDFITYAIQHKDDGSGTMDEVEEKREYLADILGE